MTDRLSMPLMPLMTALSLWHTGPQETFNRIPNPCFCPQWKTMKRRMRMRVTRIIMRRTMRTTMKTAMPMTKDSRSLMGGLVALWKSWMDIAQLSQISQQRLSHSCDYHTAACDYHDWIRQSGHHCTININGWIPYLCLLSHDLHAFLHKILVSFVDVQPSVQIIIVT